MGCWVYLGELHLPLLKVYSGEGLRERESKDLRGTAVFKRWVVQEVEQYNIQWELTGGEFQGEAQRIITNKGYQGMDTELMGQQGSEEHWTFRITGKG